MPKRLLFPLSLAALLCGALLVVEAQNRLDIHPGKVQIQSAASDALAVTGGATIVGTTTLSDAQFTGIGAGAPGKIGLSGNQLAFLGGSAGHAFFNSAGGLLISIDASGAIANGMRFSGIGAAAAGKIGLSANRLALLGGSAGHEFFNSGGGSLAIVDASGNWSMAGRINSATLQPGFLAFNSAGDSGASSLTVDFDTEVFDNASNFAADVFTAPVTGQYLFCFSVTETPNTPGSPDTVTLVTSNRSFIHKYSQQTTAIDLSLNACVHVDMDAADTASVLFQDASGGALDTINGSASPYKTYFSGRLVP